MTVIFPARVVNHRTGEPGAYVFGSRDELIDEMYRLDDGRGTIEGIADGVDAFEELADDQIESWFGARGEYLEPLAASSVGQE